MQNYLEKLANNLVVASFVPSLVFSTVIVVVLKPFTSPTLNEITGIFKETGIFIVVSSIAISLILLYLRQLIFAVFRGLYFPSFFSLEKSISNSMLEKIKKTEKLLENENNDAKIERLEDELYSTIERHRSLFPARGKLFQTRFGNILGAAEASVADCYGLDPRVLWSRLMLVLPEPHFKKIEDSNNQLSFIIYSSLLSYILSLIGFCIIANRYFDHQVIGSQIIWFSITSFVMFYLFYLSALPIAEEYSRLYCSAFDFFRFEIIKSMHLKLPQNMEQESEVWGEISELLAVGRHYNDINFSYTLPDDYRQRNILVEVKNKDE